METFNLFKNFFVFILYFQLYLSVESHSLRFVGSSRIYSPQYFKNLTIYTLNNSLYIEADLIRPLLSGIRAKIDFQIRLADSKKYQTLYGYDFDVCTMMFGYRDTLYKRWYKSFLKYGNFVSNCPFNEGHYYLSAWRMESILIPAYWFTGNYRAKACFYDKPTSKKEIFIANLTIDAKISE